MYLSRVILDEKRRETMAALESPQKLHGAVESGFDGPRERRLWRIDYLNGRCCLLVVSENKPDFANLTQQLCACQTWETRCYDALLNKLDDEQQWRFRLTANPTRSIAVANEKKRGKVISLLKPEEQVGWLARRAQSGGFRVDDVSIMKNGWRIFNKGLEKRRVSMLQVEFEGRLTVTDKALFKKALTEGIGREKAFGCGMLTVAVLQND